MRCAVAAPVVVPDEVVDAVVKVEELQVLELGPGGGEQLRAEAGVLVHGAADVEQQQDLHRVVPLRAQLQVEQAGVAGGPVDGAVQVQLAGRALPGEAAQAPQGDLEVARAELHVAVQVAELPGVPDLHGRPVPGLLLADADALGVEAVGAEGRLARRADPLVAALVAALLLLEALPEALHQLVPAARATRSAPSPRATGSAPPASAATPAGSRGSGPSPPPRPCRTRRRRGRTCRSGSRPSPAPSGPAGRTRRCWAR